MQVRAATPSGSSAARPARLIEKFEAGYTAGAAPSTPNINVLVEYIGDDETAFNDAVKGEALSTEMYDDGA